MRELRSQIAAALQSLRSRPLESSLMFATFAVVFCAATTAIGLLKTGRREIDRVFAELGQDIVHVHEAAPFGRPTTSEGRGFREDDPARLAEAVGGRAAIATVALGTVSEGPRESTAIVVATSPEWREVAGLALETGRFFDPAERDACVLDDFLAKELFGNPLEAPGKRVKLRLAGASYELKVAGVVSDPITARARLRGLDALASARPVLLRVLEGISIYLPRSVANPSQGHTLCLVRYPPAMDAEEAMRRVQKALGERAEAIFVWARKTWIGRLEKMAEFGEVFSSAVWTIVLLLAVGLLMSMALLSVSGRAVEFGVRRAEGATRSGICAQVVTEGLALGALGAIAGLAASPFVGAWLSRRLPWPMSLRAEDLLLVLGAGLLAVAVSYLAPALRAARLEPMEALREL